MNLLVRSSHTTHTTQTTQTTQTTHTTHTTHKTHAIAIVCSILRDLPSRGIPNLRQAEPGPALPEGFNGATLRGKPQEFCHHGRHDCLPRPAC